MTLQIYTTGDNCQCCQKLIAWLEGLILPTADGTVIARFASEILSSAITALAGSFVQYQQIT